MCRWIFIKKRKQIELFLRNGLISTHTHTTSKLIEGPRFIFGGMDNHVTGTKMAKCVRNHGLHESRIVHAQASVYFYRQQFLTRSDWFLTRLLSTESLRGVCTCTINKSKRTFVKQILSEIDDYYSKTK